MGGPLIHHPVRPRVTFDRMADILLRQGTAIQELARSTQADFVTLGTELQRTRELLADQMVAVETLRIQVAGLLMIVDTLQGKAAV